MEFTQLPFQICTSSFFTWRVVTERIFKFLLYLKNIIFIYLLPSKTKLAVICSTKKDCKTETTLKGFAFFSIETFFWIALFFKLSFDYHLENWNHIPN